MAGRSNRHIKKELIDYKGKLSPWHKEGISLVEKKKRFDKYQELKMNPIRDDDFDPDSWEPFIGHPDIELAGRHKQRKEPPRILETNGLKPKPIRKGQMIGEYESKQDIYLTFACRCNDLQKQIDALTVVVNKLQ